MTSVDDPNAGYLTYSYDDVGNLLSRLDAKGQVIRNEYGAANRLSATELLPSASSDPLVRYTYQYDVPVSRAPRCSRTCSVGWRR